MSEPTKTKPVTSEAGDLAPFIRDLHAPSVAVGFALSLAVVLGLSIVKKTIGLVFKLALLAVILTLIGGAYVGWLEGTR